MHENCLPSSHRVGGSFPAPNDRSLPGTASTPEAATDAHRSIGGGGNDIGSTGSLDSETDHVVRESGAFALFTDDQIVQYLGKADDAYVCARDLAEFWSVVVEGLQAERKRRS